MLTLGIDAVEIVRFAHWHNYSQARLQRIFSPAEVTYCLSNTTKSAERFAVRFAAKEAFFKSITPLLIEPIPFLYVCKHVEIVSNLDGVHLKANWEVFPLHSFAQHAKVHISLTHTYTTALAVIVISKS
jgi:holo-[acyl-carrier protein] synthase